MNRNNLILIGIKNKNEVFEIKEKLVSNGDDLLFETSRNKIFELLFEHNVDLLILDLQIEDTDAISLCQEIRQNQNIHQPYIIIVGDRPEDYVHSMVLDSGADDYILKPLKSALVIARIKALMRRKIRATDYSKNRLMINKEEHLVYFDSKKIELPRKEFDILNLLYSNPKKVFSRTEITNLIWGNDLENKDHNIDVFISKIRKELGKEVIKTIKGIGYTLSEAQRFPLI